MVPAVGTLKMFKHVFLKRNLKEQGSGNCFFFSIAALRWRKKPFSGSFSLELQPINHF